MTSWTIPLGPESPRDPLTHSPLLAPNGAIIVGGVIDVAAAIAAPHIHQSSPVRLSSVSTGFPGCASVCGVGSRNVNLSDICGAVFTARLYWAL